MVLSSSRNIQKYFFKNGWKINSISYYKAIDEFLASNDILSNQKGLHSVENVVWFLLASIIATW